MRCLFLGVIIQFWHRFIFPIEIMDGYGKFPYTTMQRTCAVSHTWHKKINFYSTWNNVTLSNRSQKRNKKTDCKDNTVNIINNQMYVCILLIRMTLNNAQVFFGKKNVYAIFFDSNYEFVTCKREAKHSHYRQLVNRTRIHFNDLLVIRMQILVDFLSSSINGFQSTKLHVLTCSNTIFIFAFLSC